MLITREKNTQTQGKNSKIKEKTQFFGIFRILRCEKDGQKKPDLKMISLLLLGTENSSDGGAQGSYPEKRSSGVQLRA